jgi:hypothetical protein
MSLSVEPKDIVRLDIKYREKEERVDGYAAVYLKRPLGPVKAFHFPFSMNTKEFRKQVITLRTTAGRAGFELNLQEKSRLALVVERAFVGALAGTEYRDRGCPACRMIDVFMAGVQDQDS